jgi:acyl-CoA thioesterase
MGESQFEQATAVTRVSEGRWSCHLDPAWSIGDKPHGGYTMATLTRAALLAADRPHPLSVSAHFLRPPTWAPAEVLTDVVRRGRTVSTVHARLVQEGKVCIEAVAAVGEISEQPLEWTRRQPPAMAPLAESHAGEGPDPQGVRSRSDLRMDPATLGFTRGEPAGEARMSGWMRLADGADPDPLMLIVAVDALPPVVLELGHMGWAPTVELTFLLRALPVPGWLQVHADANALSADGWFDENAEVYDASGQLVAQSRQLALSGTAMQRR